VSKILVVDDNRGIRLLLFETLKEDHYEVEMAANGEEALRVFVDFVPEIILLDMKMPGMSGIETLEKIRAIDGRTVVIMMTAYEDIQYMELAEDLGISYYISKPFDLFELRERLRQILNSPG